MTEFAQWKTFKGSGCAYQLKDRADSKQEAQDMLEHYRQMGTGNFARSVRSRMADHRVTYLIYVRPRWECEE
jgi:hypothetical protein